MLLKDLEIADIILEIVSDEVAAIKNTQPREPSDIVKLEKIAKIYATLMANQREVLKSGILGKLSSKELDKDLDNGGDDEDA